MPPILPGLPAETEFAPQAARYVQLALQFRDPVAALEQQLAEFSSLLMNLPVEKRLHRYATGKWSVQQVLGHIIDAERVFAYRALCAARKDPNRLPGFEEDDWAAVAGAEGCEWEDLIREFQQVRSATMSLLHNIPPEAWTRTITANSTPVSVRALAYMILGHLSHHIAILRERYL